MCYVIITCWTLLWTLLSIASFMMIIASIMSPYWLIGTLRQSGSESIYDNETGVDPNRFFTPTIGIFNRCTRLHHYRNIDERETCANFVTGYDMPDEEFPDAWKAALIFFAFTVLVLLFVTVMSIISLCTRSVCGKSIFTVCGLLQSIAGLLSIIGLVVYPAGWGSATIKKYCGEYSSPFEKDKCSLGWSFYLVIAGTVVTFLCSFLSIKADASTSSRKVEEEVLEGKNLICVV